MCVEQEHETVLSWCKAAAQKTLHELRSIEFEILWNSLKKTPNLWNKAILMFQHWYLVLPAPSRTAHLRRRNKINSNLFSFIIHYFNPGYSSVFIHINCNLVISGLCLWFIIIRRGSSLTVFTSCRSCSGPHDASIHIWPDGVQIQLVNAVEKVYFLPLLFLQTGQVNYLRRCSCKYQKTQDHLERKETRQRLPFSPAG